LVDAWDGWTCTERRGGLKRGRGMVDLSAWGEGMERGRGQKLGREREREREREWRIRRTVSQA